MQIRSGGADSTRKCNSPSGEERQAAAASTPFKPASMRGADERLHATHPGRTIPDRGTFENGAPPKRDCRRAEASQVHDQPRGRAQSRSAHTCRAQARYSIITKAPDKSAQAVTDALLTALQPHADLVHTLTYDNGKEFAYHQTVAEGLDAQGYFAHPYHSWERGLNENTNGLIRQYLPKGSDFHSRARRSAHQ